MQLKFWINPLKSPVNILRILVAQMGANDRSKVRHWLRRGTRPLALGLILLLAACAGHDIEIPKQAGLPPSAPQTVGADTIASAEHKRLVAQFGGEYHWPAAQDYLNNILARLASDSEAQGKAYRVTILNSPVVNAFALPSGNLYVTRGLLALANDTSEVAAVMAHEIAHVTARHAAQRAELEKQSAVISRAARVIQNQEKGQELLHLSQRSLASFSRQQELDADQIGVRVIAKSGFDAFAASRFLASLGRSTALRGSLIGGRKGGDAHPDILSTHPSTPERVGKAILAARQFGAPGLGNAGRSEYLAAIDGIAFGDDTSEGIIRGQRFLHPKLGFGFSAPPGFMLDNSAKALLGIANGGNEALRLDSVKLPSTTTLEAYLASGWIDGLQQATISSGTVNGLPYATATARGGEWSFRLAAIRLGTDVYRMIFATRALTDENDRVFRESIESFRRISHDEATNVHPLRLVIATASGGDTAEAFAARIIAPDRPLEYFELLNGLERGGPLKPGEKYKLVME